MLEQTLPAARPLRADTRAASPHTAAILSLASEVPAGRLTNADLAEGLGVSEEWILTRTGIRERRQAAPDERLSDFATRVGAAALAGAGVDPADLDLVIVGTLTQDEVTPNTAPLVAHGLGATRAGAFDLGAACTAFLSGLSVGAAQIECGRAERVLLIGADFVTRITDYTDRKSAPLFADGAGAVVLGRAEAGDGAIGPIILGSDGSHARTLWAPHEDRLLKMDGPEVFRHAVARMSEASLAALEAAGTSIPEIDLFVYHQANSRITQAVGERLRLPSERVVDCIEMLGNSSAGTLPLALAAAEREGRLQPGAKLLLGAFGAGFTWGGGVVEWGGRGGG